ncbi:hypothetical protein HDU87_003620 [Geranomyces variabilis]|uniref:Sodium/calcium exchanger membrane region domain-containing protein n=1 Tax=Geranomyces variabilis TaxID=109894 RepID=A0AAD5TJY0_9FUNG|nr:hypothetical protein HDU87_003620 [Geranomyces variabilis]
MHKVQSWAKHEARNVRGSPFSRSTPARRRISDSEANLNNNNNSTVIHMEGTGSTNPLTGTNNVDPASIESINNNNNYNNNNDRRNNDTTNANEKNAAHKHELTLWGQIRAALFGSYVNVLLIFVPIGIAMHFIKASSLVVFITCFIAIIPLAGMLSYATEELALRVGETLGGLLNASFGNAVELIMSNIALFSNEIVVVQTSLIGSILSNLLLVLGMSFLAGGITRSEQYFNTTVAQTASSLLALAVASLIIPTAFHWAATDALTSDKATGIPETVNTDILGVSRATAIILLLVYASYLLFQLKSHAHLFNEESKKVPTRKEAREREARQDNNGVSPDSHEEVSASSGARPNTNARGDANNNNNNNNNNTGSSANTNNASNNNNNHDDDEDHPEPELSVVAAVVLLIGATVLVAICAEFLVSAIDDVVTKTGISRYFIGLVLVPIVGNAAEHVTAVTVAARDKMDLAIGVAVGSSLQVALLIIPLIVVIAWIGGINEMTLLFDTFAVIVLVLSVALVAGLISDGKSNFLEGNLLISLYIIIAVAAWYFPNTAASA